MLSSNSVKARTGFFWRAILGALVATASTAHAAVWYVNAASTAPTPDGKSWATAYGAIRSAVELATTGDQVWIAAGTYTYGGPYPSKVVVRLKPGIIIYGGFTGTETELRQRDWTANPTIIDGEKQWAGVGADDATSVVDGFFIRYCTSGMGGGTAVNCTFSENSTSSDGGGKYYGTATNCLFIGNVAQYRGGGMYGGTATNCEFRGNSARDGGGMAGGTANNCMFTENSARDGGGMYGGTVNKCVFLGNSGGGMHEGTATNCVFTRNLGCGMRKGTAINCTFTENVAKTPSGCGGGIYNGTATNCIIWGNAPIETSHSTVSYSCLSEATAGTGNVVGNPRFVKPWAGDLRLRADSTCVDAGTSANAPTADFLGRARPAGATVDMGAYEYHTGDDAGAGDAPILRVNAASTVTSPDGLTWETAYSTIQAAADHTGYGGEIWVAAGTYTGTGDDVVKPRPGTLLLGGFVGTETVREQRDAAANPTSIDGQQTRRCITADGTFVVDGFTICNGKADQGGGMYFGAAAHCTFKGNASVGDSRVGGGGMYYGTATDCVFSENSAPFYGGGMYFGVAANCTFMENSAAEGAGAYSVTASNCIFIRNSALSGGGMSDGTATNCTFTGNAAMGRWDSGGGMRDGTASNCILWGNIPDETYGTTVSCSCLSEPTAGAGNIAGNPEFVKPWAGDFRLRVLSPCIDSGTSVGAPDMDILGRTRPAGAAVDMGAIEFYPGDDAQIEHAPILRVNAALMAANPDGLTWETAYPTIQAAADHTGYGGEIWVAAGTYSGTGDEVVRLLPGTALFGGFNGTETARDRRDAAAYPTTIDGQDTRRGITANDMSSVDGFTIIHGKADIGGGMYYGAATNCTFTENAANDHGGGMYCGTATVCTFTSNYSAGVGGGMYEGAATDCTFTGNLTPNQGGGMDGGTAIDCTFYANMAHNGSGIHDGTAINCTFIGNTAQNCGGGMAYGAATNCTFFRNWAMRGGGMYQGTAINCILWGNAADETFNTAVSYCCLSVATAGVGNIVGNPRFVNPFAGDVRLCADSPCVDTGTVEGAPATDFLGRVRPAGVSLDMGAYEYHPGDDAQSAYAPSLLRVSTASTAANPDGLTWETAYPTLQEAVYKIGCGGEIWVAAGTYTGSEYAVVSLHPGTALFGGFNGTETVREQRNAAVNLTIIDGQHAGGCVYAFGACSVDGFTLRNGKAHRGGGMHFGRAINCRFTGNVADEGGGMYYGTAINCLFTGNSAGGGGSGMVGGAAVNCIFTGSPDYYGIVTSLSTVTNCIVWGNTRDGMDLCAVSYSCLGSAVEMIAGTDNIFKDPLFVNAAAGDFRLQPGSPCIDMGTAEGAPETDILGVPRPQGAGIDMGAYEMVQVPVPDLSGLARTAVREVVAASYLYVRAETEEYSEVIPVDHVMGQRPVAGLQVLAGTPVDVVISRGPDVVPVPDLTGLARAAAKELIAAAQLYAGRETEEFHPTVPPEQVVRHVPAAGVQAPRWSLVDLVISKGPQPVPVPDVVGQMQDAAVATLAGVGLSVGTVTPEHSLTIPAGTVMAQSPAPGTEVLPGAAVDLMVSAGGMVVPDLTGQAQGAAITVLTGARLVVGTVVQAYSQTVPAGSVISQSLPPGAPVLPGTPVDLVVSRGAPPSVMPDMVGQPRAQAVSAVAEAGLVLGLVTAAYSDTVAAGRVISQSPAAGTELPPGMTVSLVVSLGAMPATEGEGEPVDADTAREALDAAFADADTNGDDVLSFEEAAAWVPGLPRAVFDELDTDGDGQLSQAELAVDNHSGCAGCRGNRKTFDPARMGDLFLMALGALGLAVMATLRRP